MLLLSGDALAGVDAAHFAGTAILKRLGGLRPAATSCPRSEGIRRHSRHGGGGGGGGGGAQVQGRGGGGNANAFFCILHFLHIEGRFNPV